jgi:enolase
VWSGVLTPGEVGAFLLKELPLSVLLAFLARHVVIAAHMMGHYLEARRQGILATDVVERVRESGIEAVVDDRPWRKLSWAGRRRKLVWYGRMFLTIPYGRYPGVDQTGNLFTPNLFVRTAAPNIAVQARGPQVGKRIADVALGLGVPLLVLAVFLAGSYPEWIQYALRLAFMIGGVAALDVHRTDNDAYRKYQEEVRTQKQQSSGGKGEASTGRSEGSLLQVLTDPSSRMSAATMPVMTSRGVSEEQLLQPHQFRSILEGRGTGANVSMGQFGVVVMGGNERFAEIFVSALQDRIKILLQKTPGLTHLGLSSRGSERGTFTPGSIRLTDARDASPVPALSDEEAIRALAQAVEDVGGCPYGSPVEEGQAEVILGIAPQADELAAAYRRVRRTNETGKYLFDLKEGDKLELDSNELRQLYLHWHREYGVRIFINPFAEDDLLGYWKLKQELGGEAIVVAGNLLKSSAERMRQLSEQLATQEVDEGPRALTDLMDVVLLVPAQVGTISEIVAAATEAERQGLGIMMGRSAAATTDPLEADLALGLGAVLDSFGGSRNVEVLDKISHKAEVMEVFRRSIPLGRPARNERDITIVDMKAYSRLTNARLPTMSVIVTLSDGDQFTVDVPVGRFATREEAGKLQEAAHLVDGEEREYQGRGVKLAIESFDTVIAPMFLGKSIWDLPSLVDVDRMLLAMEKEHIERQESQPLPPWAHATPEQLHIGEATGDIQDVEALEYRRRAREALTRKSALGMQPLAAASIAVMRLLARVQGKESVQLIREARQEPVDEDYLYGFTDDRTTHQHLQGHWILANHDFMSFHMAFLSGVVFFLRSLVVDGTIAAGNLPSFLGVRVPFSVALAAVLAGVVASLACAWQYLRDRRQGRLSQDTVLAVRRSGCEEGVDESRWTRARWCTRLALLLPLGRYPGVEGIPFRRRAGIVALLAFFLLYMRQLVFPSDDLIGFFVTELGHSLILAFLIGQLAMGAHEAGHYLKARFMNRLTPAVLRRVKEEPVAGAFERDLIVEDENLVAWRPEAAWWKRLLWVAYMVATAPLGRFPGVELSVGRFAPNLTVRTTVQGEDALPIRAAGPKVDRFIFLAAFPASLILSAVIVFSLQGHEPHLAEYAQLCTQFLFGLAVVSGLSIRTADEGALVEERRLKRRDAERQKELAAALAEAGRDVHLDAAWRTGPLVDNPRDYFIRQRSESARLVTYIKEDGTEEHLIPVHREQNTIQGGLHVDLIKKGAGLLGGYEVVIAIGNLHLQEFMLIPETRDEAEKAAISSAIQLQVVRILNEYEGLMNAGQGLEGGQAVNLAYGALPWKDIPGYEWIADARYAPTEKDEERPYYLEEIQSDDDTATKERKQLYQLPEEEAWKILLLATIQAGYTPGNKVVPEDVLKEKPRVWFGLDGATSSLFFEYNRERGVQKIADAEVGYRFYKHPFPREIDRTEFIRIYTRWLARYPIAMIEDPFGETDLEGWKQLYETELPDGGRVGDRYIVIGDDAVVTDESYIRHGKREQAFNAILIKPNQIGTLSETARAIVAAYETVISKPTYEKLGELVERVGQGAGEPGSKAQARTIALIDELDEAIADEQEQVYQVVISHRSQSPDDPVEAIIAVAANALAGKMGGSLNFERQSKYSLLEVTSDFVERGLSMWKYRPNGVSVDSCSGSAGEDVFVTYVYPQEIFANSGTPTSRVTLFTSNGTRFRGATPIGTSAGSDEAEHGLDYDKGAFKGKGVTKALAHAQKIGDGLIGVSIWDKRLSTLTAVDRYLLQAELAELEGSGELKELVDNALKRARARGSGESEADITREVTITAQKRKRKLWMNAILPVSIATMRLLAYRDGKYAWEVLREELQRIISARLPKYRVRDGIRDDARDLLASIRDAVASSDTAALATAPAALRDIRSRIAEYWSQENYDAHGDYLYGFSEMLPAAEPPSGDHTIEAPREFAAHRLRPLMSPVQRTAR